MVIEEEGCSVFVCLFKALQMPLIFSTERPKYVIFQRNDSRSKPKTLSSVGCV